MTAEMKIATVDWGSANVPDDLLVAPFPSPAEQIRQMRMEAYMRQPVHRPLMEQIREWDRIDIARLQGHMP